MLLVRIGVPFSQNYEAIPALLDCGSDQTLIPGTIVNKLKLNVVHDVTLANVTGRLVSFPTFLADLAFDALPARRCLIAAVDFVEYAILGRDFLNHYKITLDGPNLTLNIEAAPPQ